MRIALALPYELEDRIVPEAAHHGHEIVSRSSSAGELASRIESVGADVALVEATERHLTENLLRVCDDAAVRVLAVVAGEIERRHAASVGLLETVDATASWSEIEGALVALGRVSEVVDIAREPRHGLVIAVWGPAGAPGRTTLAINVAAEIAAAGYAVALGDVDTHSGSIAPSLGLLDEAPGFAAACRLAGAESLTRAELERIGQRYSSGHSGFWVLTGIGRPSRWPELSASRVEATITECRTWVDYTVLDTGFSLEHDEEISTDLFAPRRNAATLAALQEADTVIAVGSADPVGMSRFLRSHVDLIETVAAERVLVAMNKVRASAVGANPAGQVRQTLARFGGIDHATLIPYDRAGTDAAQLSGKTLADAAPKSSARAAIRELVTDRLLPAPVTSLRPRRRGMRRWAG
ncbi:regulator [Glaciihabitans sp. dw_435]|uniref:AAA family ATPase n=1 Tax=Glaciihabitans sp. dw_435 TaxID=2720081 RepID=UPI001BD1D745|nr:regulator [Glaciihabitans sp. dw_435]